MKRVTKALTPAEVKAIAPHAKPTVPVVYEEAVKQLALCRTLDEAKYFDNKADALAAWAKIYKDDSAGRQAKALKLHAYARMGALARELRPHKALIGGGSAPGPKSLLKDNGFSPNAAGAAIFLSRHPEVLNKEVNASRPRSPTTVLIGDVRKGTHAWKKWAANNGGRNKVSWLKSFDPKLAAQMTKDEAKLAVKEIIKLQEWCDDFLRFAEKAK